MKPELIIAVDPGASGGIAVWSDKREVVVHPMPDTRRALIAMFNALVSSANYVTSYIEKINGYIPDGGASQMFEFGRSVERVGCILETLRCPINEISPQNWQKVLALGTSEKERASKNATPSEKAEIKRRNQSHKREWKRKLLEEAQRRHPELHITLKTCDAILIMEAARILESQKL